MNTSIGYSWSNPEELIYDPLWISKLYLDFVHETQIKGRRGPCSQLVARNWCNLI